MRLFGLAPVFFKTWVTAAIFKDGGTGPEVSDECTISVICGAVEGSRPLPGWWEVEDLDFLVKLEISVGSVKNEKNWIGADQAVQVHLLVCVTPDVVC